MVKSGDAERAGWDACPPFRSFSPRTLLQPGFIQKRGKGDREKTARRRKGARKRKKEVEKKGWQANQGSS